MDETKKINSQLIINILLLLVILALCGYIAVNAFKDHQQAIISQGIEQKPETIEGVQTSNEATSIDLATEYMQAGFKVAFIVPNPFNGYTATTSPFDAIYVVTKRDGDEDSWCGGRKQDPSCYFFLESTVTETLVPRIKFIGTWGNGSTSLLKQEDIRFVDPYTVELKTSQRDYDETTLNEIWHLDLTTGSTTLISATTTTN